MPHVLKTILIVDDEPGVRALVRMTLESGSVRILEAADGEQGLALARTERPDLILLDVMMPKMNGYEVCSALKNDETTSRAVVLLLTAQSRPSDRARAAAAGADGYFTKPFSPTKLLDVIDEHLREVPGEKGSV